MNKEHLNGLLSMHKSRYYQEASRWRTYMAWYRSRSEEADNDSAISPTYVPDDRDPDEDPYTMDSDSDDLRFQKNYTFAYVDTMRSMVVPNKMQPEVHALDPAQQDAADDRTAYLENIFKREKMVRQMKRCASLASLFGRAYTKIVWDHRQKRVRYHTIHPRYIWADPYAEQWEDVRYVIELTVVSWAEFSRRRKKDYLPTGKALYSTRASGRIKADRFPSWLITSADDKKLSDSDTGNDAAKWVLIYEIWDFVEDKLHHAATPGASNDDGPRDVEIIYTSDLPYKHLRNPYKELVFNESLDDRLGIPDPQLYEHTQKRLDEMSAIEMQFSHQSVPYAVLNKGAVKDPTAVIEQLQVAGGPMKVLLLDIKSEFLSGPAGINSVLGHTPTPQLAPQFTGMRQELMRNIEFVLGLPGYARGQGGTSKVATDLALIDQATQDRAGERLSRVVDIAVDIARDTMALVEEMASTEFKQRVRRNVDSYRVITKKSMGLQGFMSIDELYDYDITITERPDTTRALLMQKLLPVIELLLTMYPQIAPKLIVRILALLGFSDMIEEKDLEQLLAQAQPMAPPAPGEAPPEEGAPMPPEAAMPPGPPVGGM
jgi:hypothetical protein